MGICLDDAKVIIAPDIARLLLESIVTGFEDYFKKVPDESRAICSATTRANFINDHMIYHARDKMKAHSQVQFVLRRGRTHLIISEQLEIKLKKLNRNRRPSNIITQEVSDYHNQIPLKCPQQLEFPDMLNPIANLIAGYQLNSIKTGIEAVYVVCPQGSRNRWELKLDFAPKPVIIAEPEPIVDSSKPKRVVAKKQLIRDRNN
jgi:hypothetical protein